MNTTEILYISIGVVIAAILQYYDLLFTLLFVVFLICIGCVGIYLSVSWSLVTGKQYKPTTMPTEPTKVKDLIDKMMEKKSEKFEEQKRVVVSRNIDDAIREVMDHVIRDFVLTWYTDLSKDQQTVVNAVKNDAWIMVEKLRTRMSKINTVKLMTQDVIEILNKHFVKIRLCSTSEEPDRKKFILHAWLENDATEVEYLRTLCDALLIVLLPSNYGGCISLRHLFREIITSTVLKPTVDMLCDPDYINRKLISYIDYRQRLSEDTNRTYTYAATYEDFIKLIDKCNDIEHLKQMRYNILTEIIHATTIDNLKKEQGVISADRTSPTPALGKGELLKARNLKRYINQLSVAKNKCEKRLHSLGGPEYKAYDLESDNLENSQKVLSFQEIVDSPTAKEEFVKFLKKSDSESLIGFWNATEKLRYMDKKLQHHQASEIYQQYIAGSKSCLKLDKSIIKGMEAFMLGNVGPESFFEGQMVVRHILETQHYPSFLVSDIYNRYIRSLDDGNMDFKAGSSKASLLFKPNEMFVDVEDDDEEMFASQSYEAQARLQQLDEKIQNKQQALMALKTSRTSDEAKIEKLEKDLDEEIKSLTAEKRKREDHILRTRTWIENQGKWGVHVYGAEMVKEQDKKILVYVLVVFRTGGDATSQNLQNSSDGWTVSRNLADFQALHENLCQIGPWLKKKDIPTAGIFTTIDEKFIEESKKTWTNYLEMILKDERMSHSEDLYAFLSPSPEYFKHNKSEKSNFFLRNFQKLKKLPSRQTDTLESGDDDLLFGINGNEEESKLDRNVDSIAAPFYKLVNEIFESRGMFKWFRKSFMTFVEITFGRTINRQLCETVDWIFSESMIIYYIRQFTMSMWPDGKLAEAEPSRSDEEKMKTRMEAKDKFLQNMPDAVKTLLGEDNGRRGTIKIFEVLQDTKLNKQLFYELLNLLTFELCPEIKAKKACIPDTTKETKY